MDAIRVHFGPMPEMLRAIMSDLLEQEPDIMIVGTSSQRNECLHAAYEARAEIIIVQDVVHEGGACLDLILAGPSLGLFAISDDGMSATGVSLARQPIMLDAESPSNLADAIRDMATRQRAPAFPPTGSGAEQATPIAGTERSDGPD